MGQVERWELEAARWAQLVRAGRDASDSIVEAFASQRPKDWFDEELFLGLMRVRGMEVRSPSGYAEAFTCRKLSLGTT